MVPQKPEDNMIFTREIFAILTCSVMIMLPHCNADRLPPPVELSYRWLDPFTVNVSWSWQRPSGLPENCEIKYEYRLLENGCSKRTEWRNFSDICLTEEIESGQWTYTLHTVASKLCVGWNDSTSVNITIDSQKPRAQVVKDFRCVLDRRGTKCSWIPVNQSFKPTVAYRICGSSEELRKSLKECDHHNSSCYLNVDAGENSICILAKTEIGWSTFNPSLVIHSPKLSIKRDKNRLNLNWTPPEVGKDCPWIYEFCYTQCNGPKQCNNFSIEEKMSLPVKTHKMPYNENCQYKFRSRVLNSKYCPVMISDWSEEVSYGTNKPPDWTLTAVTILVPILLFLCVILSCYCFRKHRDIICPIIPDPSAIFKEMMNGNKDIKTGGSLYTPVPEPVEPCKITLMTQSNVLQQSS